MDIRSILTSASYSEDHGGLIYKRVSTGSMLSELFFLHGPFLEAKTWTYLILISPLRAERMINAHSY